MLPYVATDNPDRLVHPDPGVAGFAAGAAINQLQTDPEVRRRMAEAAQQIRTDTILMDRLCERVYGLLLADCRLQSERVNPLRRSLQWH